MLAYTIGIIILFPVPIKLVTDLIVHSRSSQVAQCHVFIAFTTLSPPPPPLERACPDAMQQTNNKLLDS